MLHCGSNIRLATVDKWMYARANQLYHHQFLESKALVMMSDDWCMNHVLSSASDFILTTDYYKMVVIASFS